MNTHENDVLDQELRALADDVPPMPEDFHAGWMKKEEEEAMQKKPSKIRWTRILSIAAALVFVIGGTMLSRDSFSGAPRTSETTTAYNAPSGGINYSMRSSASASPQNSTLVSLISYLILRTRQQVQSVSIHTPTHTRLTTTGRTPPRKNAGISSAAINMNLSK